MAIPTPITLEGEEKKEKVYNMDHGKLIDLTEDAISYVKDFFSKNEKVQGKNFKVYVEGGGCSGMQYGFTFADKTDDDEVVACADIEVLVDKNSIVFVKGAVVDYVNDFTGSGFVVKNPQSAAECGCGVSFTV